MSIKTSSAKTELNTKNTREKVKFLKEYFLKVEQGKLDYKQFKSALVKDLNIQTTDKFENVINSANKDKKTFTKILQSLEILKKKEKMPIFDFKIIQKQNNKRFPRFLKHKVSGPAEPRNELQKVVSEFVSGQLTIPQFSKELKKHNINTDLEEVQRQFNNFKNGQVDFKTVLAVAERNKGSMHSKKLSELLQEQAIPRNKLTNLSLDPTSDVKNLLLEKRSKKKSLALNPSYISKRDIFMWEKMTTLNHIAIN